jgi:hypothetical protein
MPGVYIGPDLVINAGGLPDEMEAFIDFYKNGYSEASFTTSYGLYYSAGARHYLSDLTRGDFVQVPYSSYQIPLHIDVGNNYVHDVSGDASSSVIYAENILPIPTDGMINAKKIPYYGQVDNSEDYTETIPLQYYVNYYTYPESYPTYVSDLRSRFKTPALIEEQSTKYIEEKVSILRDMLDSLLVMPKEFRVRMQASTPYNLANVSSIPDGESMSTPTTTITAGTTTGMSSPSAGGSGGGSY